MEKSTGTQAAHTDSSARRSKLKVTKTTLRDLTVSGSQYADLECCHVSGPQAPTETYICPFGTGA